METSEIGNIFEDIACKYLESKGYKVLLRNIYVGKDEIDIVCRQTSSGVLVFVEVKGLKSFKSFSPEMHFGREKQYKFKRACQMFAGKQPKLIKKSGYRLDLLAIVLNGSFLNDWRKDCEFRHYENVVA